MLVRWIISSKPEIVLDAVSGLRLPGQLRCPPHLLTLPIDTANSETAQRHAGTDQVAGD